MKYLHKPKQSIFSAAGPRVWNCWTSESRLVIQTVAEDVFIWSDHSQCYPHQVPINCALQILLLAYLLTYLLIWHNVFGCRWQCSVHFVVVDDGGRWGRGGLFTHISSMSRIPEQQYAFAGRMKGPLFVYLKRSFILHSFAIKLMVGHLMPFRSFVVHELGTPPSPVSYDHSLNILASLGWLSKTAC